MVSALVFRFRSELFEVRFFGKINTSPCSGAKLGYLVSRTTVVNEDIGGINAAVQVHFDVLADGKKGGSHSKKQGYAVVFNKQGVVLPNVLYAGVAKGNNALRRTMHYATPTLRGCSGRADQRQEMKKVLDHMFMGRLFCPEHTKL